MATRINSDFECLRDEHQGLGMMQTLTRVLGTKGGVELTTVCQYQVMTHKIELVERGERDVLWIS